MRYHEVSWISHGFRMDFPWISQIPMDFMLFHDGFVHIKRPPKLLPSWLVFTDHAPAGFSAGRWASPHRKACHDFCRLWLAYRILIYIYIINGAYRIVMFFYHCSCQCSSFCNCFKLVLLICLFLIKFHHCVHVLFTFSKLFHLF